MGAGWERVCTQRFPKMLEPLDQKTSSCLVFEEKITTSETRYVHNLSFQPAPPRDVLCEDRRLVLVMDVRTPQVSGEIPVSRQPP